MSITTLSSRQFNQDTAGAKKAAMKGPVFISDRGRPAHVLLSIEQYQALTGSSATVVELLSHAGAAAIRFRPPRLRSLARPAEFD